jgi:hypothetical protein
MDCSYCGPNASDSSVCMSQWSGVGAAPVRSRYMKHYYDTEISEPGCPPRGRKADTLPDTLSHKKQIVFFSLLAQYGGSQASKCLLITLERRLSETTMSLFNSDDPSSSVFVSRDQAVSCASLASRFWLGYDAMISGRNLPPCYFFMWSGSHLGRDAK